MSLILNALTSSVLATYEYFTASLDKKEVMIEFQPFGASAWKTHLGLDLIEPDVPADMLKALETPCRFWPDKLIKETHMLCLVPKNVTVDELFDLAEKPALRATIKHFDKEAYWILITKEIIPESVGGCFEIEREKISKYGYDIPSVLEAAVAVLSGKYLTGLPIYPTQECATICSGNYNNQRVTVGYGSVNPFEISPYELTNGIAGVIRSGPKRELG